MSINSSVMPFFSETADPITFKSSGLGTKMQKGRGIAWGPIKNVKQDAGRNHCPENGGGVLGQPFGIVIHHPSHTAAGADSSRSITIIRRVKFCRINNPANAFMRTARHGGLSRPVSEGRGKPPGRDEWPVDCLREVVQFDELELVLRTSGSFFIRKGPIPGLGDGKECDGEPDGCNDLVAQCR